MWTRNAGRGTYFGKEAGSETPEPARQIAGVGSMWPEVRDGSGERSYGVVGFRCSRLGRRPETLSSATQNEGLKFDL